MARVDVTEAARADVFRLPSNAFHKPNEKDGTLLNPGTGTGTVMDCLNTLDAVPLTTAIFGQLRRRELVVDAGESGLLMVAKSRNFLGLPYGIVDAELHEGLRRSGALHKADRIDRTTCGWAGWISAPAPVESMRWFGTARHATVRDVGKNPQRQGVDGFPGKGSRPSA